jgi:hypothetical protein
MALSMRYNLIHPLPRTLTDDTNILTLTFHAKTNSDPMQPKWSLRFNANRQKSLEFRLIAVAVHPERRWYHATRI